MKTIGGIIAAGAALAALALLYGCASYPVMSVAQPPEPAVSIPGGSDGATSGPGRGGESLRSGSATPITVPGMGPARAPAAPATAEQIAQLVPDAPINATLTAQPVGQYLTTLFNDVLRVPLSMSPELGRRTELITVAAPQNTSRRTYVALVQTTLRSFGMTLSATPAGFTVTEDGASTTGVRGTPIVRSRSSADTPAGNTVVIQFFQLVALRAEEVLAAFAPTPTGGSGPVLMGVPATADPAANAIVLQGPGRSVAPAIEFLRNLDQPAFAGAQVVRLEPIFWAPDAFAQALSQALQAEGFIVAADPLGEKSIMILPMIATNQTFVFAADAATMTRVQYWANTLDQPSAVGDQSTTYVYEVRNTSASTIGQMLINAGAQAGRAGIVPGGGFNGAAANAVGQPGGQPQQAGRGGGGNAAANQGRGGQANAQAGRGGAANQAGRGGANAARGGQGRAGAGAAGAVPTGGVITIDDASNRILFTGSPSQFSQLRGLLRQLDTPAREVLVEVTVAEVTLTDETTWGVEWFFNQAHGTSGGVDVSGGTMIRVPGATTTTTTGTGANQVITSVTAPDSYSSGLGIDSRGFNASWMNGPNLRAQFNAFASNDKVNILSRPQVSARSGSPAEINVGARVPTLRSQQAANTGNTNDTSSVVQQIVYEQTGVVLQITPVVYGDNQVEITVYQEVSSVRDNPNPDIDSPFIDNRTVSTVLSLADGQTAVLGGLMQDNYRKGNGGIPFLKDIPILGTFFRTDSVLGAKTELMVLITPFIIRDEADMNDMTRQMVDSVNNAFRASRGGSYTLTPFPTGQSIGISPPNPVITGSSLARPPGAGRGP